MFTNNFTGLFRLLRGFLALVMVFIMAKCLFIGCYPDIFRPAGGLRKLPEVIFHGLPMDCSMSAYLCVLPALLILASIWCRRGFIRIALRGYTVIISVIVAAAIVADTVLYGYWNFKLDTTALFYLSTSFSSAMASVSGWEVIAGVAATVLLSWGIYLVVWLMWRPTGEPRPGKQIPATCVMIIAMVAMIPVIRGGLTVSTMNLSSAYFSSRPELNHAAVNPLFSFMYSATHQNRFASQFRYFEDEEAREIYLSLLEQADNCDQDSSAIIERPHLSTERPDIYLLILESFSSYLFPSLGGEPVALRLDSVARSGITFTNFHASSFRTDRSLPAILSGYPGQPTTSIMKYVSKAENLPSLPRSLKDAGYHLEYFYGGDINFTNMKAYLVSSGFSEIVSDQDFPISQRLSKWGVHDGPLLDMAAAKTADQADGDTPLFAVIQTSSSHEPFEVPFTSQFEEPRLNAFAYTDSCVAGWINNLQADTARWNRSLVIMVPDHWAVWPREVSQGPDRHRIPLIMTGGAITTPLPAQVPLIASQTDIAATLLAMLGIKPNGEMPFSHDIFNPQIARHAFMSEPEVAALITPCDTAIVNIATGETTSRDSMTADRIRAYLQTLYSDLDKR